jgi:methyl-accepting chemotaxis protein
LSDVPSATVVQDGKLGGDVPKGGAGGGGKARSPYKRKLSNYLLDKRLQLRYILLVTILSGVISGSLGYLIYQQRHAASESIERDLAALTQDDQSLKQFQQQVAAGMAAEDRALIYKMVGVGIGLVVILSLYLVLMTHKVAGPLYKISMYFDRMAEGRLGNVTALRRGDMLQDFFGNFREMHEAVRTRMQSDVITMESAAVALRAKATAEGKQELADALDSLDKHLTARKKQLL